ncbi:MULTISPECIES: type II secretion system minor pseudopilin GspJ [unclassified Pseudomonas]|uniref:type II secretion system minor pseudopilin GspJ n=1 Tax=unclassified Pseudomonas TaxID=196821 RepID=UPI0035BF4504
MCRQRGFTLLEVMIAVAIFSLLAMGTYRMLSTVLKTDEVTRQHERDLRELSRAFSSLDRDINQTLNRSVRDAYGDERATLLGELGASDGNAALEFSRNGWRNPLGGARAQVQRVRWRLAGETLERLYWNVLDQAVDSQPRVQKVLAGVQSMNLRFLDDQGQWQEQWPPSQSNLNAQDAKKRVPLALEVKIEHRHYGELSRLYRLPEPAMAEEESNAQPSNGEQPGEKEQGGTLPAEKPTDDESAIGGYGATQ